MKAAEHKQAIQLIDLMGVLLGGGEPTRVLLGCRTSSDIERLLQVAREHVKPSEYAYSFDPKDPIGSLLAAAGDERMAGVFGLVRKQWYEGCELDTAKVFDFIERERTIGQVLRSFAAKHDAVHMRGTQRDKLHSVQTATCGAPGTGKTRTADYIASLNAMDPDKLRDLARAASAELTDEFCRTVSSWVPLAMTFNGATPLLPPEANGTPFNTGCALRLLLSCCALFEEIKYSAEGSVTSVDTNEVLSKWQKLMQLIDGNREWLERVGLQKSDLILVIIACRKVTRNVEFPKGSKVIIVGRDALMSLYGPNLSCRPQFMTPVAGAAQAVVGGQPLLVVGVAEPIVLIWGFLHDFSERRGQLGHGALYLAFCAWACVWCALALLALAALNACSAVRLLTRFVNESFGGLISALFFSVAVRGLISEFTLEPQQQRPWHTVNGLWQLVLALGLALSSLWAVRARGWRCGTAWARSLWADYGVPVLVVAWTALSFAVDGDRVPRRVHAPNAAAALSYAVPARAMAEVPGSMIAAAIVPGAIVAALIFFDHNVSSRMSLCSEHVAAMPAIRLVPKGVIYGYFLFLALEPLPTFHLWQRLPAYGRCRTGLC
eukprot:m51a1_g11047 putative boron transporter 4-like (605) ;mRNA; r:494890-499102